MKTVLARSGVLPGSLKLELTESLVMENPGICRPDADPHPRLGAGLSLDDFGTGYSALSYLQRFPFDTIKIDQSFVRQIGNGRPRSCARSSGWRTSSAWPSWPEGAEIGGRRAALAELGCEYAQGYAFGEPMSLLQARQLVGRGARGRLSRGPRTAPPAPARGRAGRRACAGSAGPATASRMARGSTPAVQTRIGTRAAASRSAVGVASPSARLRSSRAASMPPSRLLLDEADRVAVAAHRPDDPAIGILHDVHQLHGDQVSSSTMRMRRPFNIDPSEPQGRARRRAARGYGGIVGTDRPVGPARAAPRRRN